MQKILTAKIDGRGMEDNLEIIDAILEERGIEDLDEFLHPNPDDILPLEDLKHIDEAAQAILDSVCMGETFLVYYDTDVDGCTSGSIATRYLQHLGADVYTYINEGKKHGIDEFNTDLLDDIDIVWIVDSIQTNIDPYKKMLDKNVKIIITDHHLVSEELQEKMEELGIILVSSAVEYDNPDLSGSATTWKLCQYIDFLNLDDFSDNLIDLAATGLISDMCSMMSPENRAICDKAFKNLKNPGIKKINGGYAFVARNISFGIAPKINAANRVNENNLAMQVFLTDDEDEISQIIKGLNQCKERQNKIVDEIMPDLIQQGNKQIGSKCKFFFIPSEMDAQISGLLGNKLLEIYSTPLLVIGQYGDEYSGSARAVGVKSFKKYFEDVDIGWSGGHPNAFGCGIPIDRFEEFQQKILESLSEVEFVSETVADIQMLPEQVTDVFIKNLNSINRISGADFEPISVMIETDNYDVKNMSGGKHLKIVDNDTGMIFVKWNYNGSWDFSGTFRAIGTLEKAHYGRTDYRQLTVQDFDVYTTK